MAAKPGDDGTIWMQQRSFASAREALLAVCGTGNVSLVLGAGVSLPHGIPKWEELAQRVWQKVFPEKPSPWKVPNGVASPREVPQFLPIVFELAAEKLGERGFEKVLCDCLYRDVKKDWHRGLRTSRSTLAVLARAIERHCEARARRRLLRVVTFNTDELLEQAVHRLHGMRKDSPVLTMARPSGEQTWPAGRNRVPVYHVHGFVARLPEREFDPFYLNTKLSFLHTLVFTDLQYWRSTAMPLSHANRVVSGALSDSHCLFVGLSMTDANLLRWLALRRVEFQIDARERATHKLEEAIEAAKQGQWRVASAAALAKELAQTIRNAPRVMGKKLPRHFWIRTRSMDPTGFISEFLRLRGVLAVEIDSWDGPELGRLMEGVLPGR